MQDIIGSVRRSLVFRTTSDNNGETGLGTGAFVDKINSCIRKSRIFNKTLPAPPLRSVTKGDALTIRWRKGELIGCGAFGQVYMGMNLDSGELLAVKQVLIAVNSASKEKAQAHIKELEEEVKVLKDLSHQNIVRYLGTVREQDTLNILLEFVSGGSISSLLGKFGAFPEAVVRTYTKQLMLGLEYLHKNGIMHRDIKGANILVDNKGCIKLADFGASKQVVELATISGAKSMKGTPYWMAPEVILQTGHSFSADIWSVGCTVIEMATGKPPWSQQYQEVAALFHIGTTKSPPPIPDHLSVGAKDFLMKCLEKEPNLRPTASELLQHPFVTGEQLGPISHSSPLACSRNPLLSSANVETLKMQTASDSMDMCNWGSLHCQTVCTEKLSENQCLQGFNSDDDMCQLDDQDDFKMCAMKPLSQISNNFKSFNPMSELADNWNCDSVEGVELVKQETNLGLTDVCQSGGHTGVPEYQHKDLSFPPSLSEDDDEVTESKIQTFLDEKALELKKMQTPLYEEFYNSMSGSCSPNLVESCSDETASKFLKLPPKSRSPCRGTVGIPSKAVDWVSSVSPRCNSRHLSKVGNTYASDRSLQDTPSTPFDGKALPIDSIQQQDSPSISFAERQRKWKEELDQELQKQREMMRQAGVGGKPSIT